MPLQQPSQRPAVDNIARMRHQMGQPGLRQAMQRPPGVQSPPSAPVGAPLTLRQAYTPRIGLRLGT